VDGPEYPLNPICAAPGCLQPSADPHHLWRRTELGGPYWWVQVTPGSSVGNLVGLCGDHHHAITVNANWITFDQNIFFWESLFSTGVPLSWQPPTRLIDVLQEPLADPESNGQAALEANTCPTCLRPLPHARSEHEGKRLRRTWSITVPSDEREQGADMLDTLLEEGRREMARAGLPYGDEDAAKYFVLSTMLGLFVTHAEEVLSDA